MPLFSVTVGSVPDQKGPLIQATARGILYISTSELVPLTMKPLLDLALD